MDDSEDVSESANEESEQRITEDQPDNQSQERTSRYQEELHYLVQTQMLAGKWV